MQVNTLKDNYGDLIEKKQSKTPEQRKILTDYADKFVAIPERELGYHTAEAEIGDPTGVEHL